VLAAARAVVEASYVSLKADRRHGYQRRYITILKVRRINLELFILSHPSHVITASTL
jgi:hypothetical protein